MRFYANIVFKNKVCTIPESGDNQDIKYHYRFNNIPTKVIKAFTCDNGKEFTKFKQIEDGLESLVCFANPYHSWERGTNENTNGLLRQYFPKGYNFENVTKEDIDLAVYKINHRPRKVLGFRTAHEVFWSEINKGCCN